MPVNQKIIFRVPGMLWIKSFKNSFFIAVFAILFFNNTIHAQQNTLQLSSPEKEGVSSAGIDTFLNAVARSHHEFHSFMFLRHGKVVAQGWWNPYGPTLKHSLYSLSKSFTSTAIGFAVSEKRLTVNDKVVSFFPGSLPDTIKSDLANLTIKDLLTMSVGQEPDPTGPVITTNDDWIKAFLKLPFLHKPGTQFLYNSMATFMLSAIVQKVTGQKVVDYLKPRLFDPLGITGIDWEINKQGINTGGWGLRLKTEDIAKVGQFYLQKGMWNGKQLLSKEWVQEATTFKIDQAPNAPQSKKDSSDWMQGYCYQFWRCRNNAYRGDGAFGQYMIVMPDQDAVIAVTAEVGNMQDELNLIWKYLLPAMQPQALPVDKAAEARLKTHLAALALPSLSSNLAGPISLSKTFTTSQNSLNIKSISVKISDKICHLSIKKGDVNYTVDFATGKWLPGKTEMQGPAITAAAHEDFSLLSPYKTEGSYEWIDANTLLLKLRYIESPHAEIITCQFNEGKLNAVFEDSFAYGKVKTKIQGEQVK